MTLTTPHQLLDELARQLAGLELGDIKVRLSNPVTGPRELQVEALQRKQLLPVEASLHPTRNLVDRLTGKPVVLVACHLPDRLAAACRQQGLCHADLNGRLYLKTSFVLVDREPKRADFRNPVTEPNAFAAKATRLVRAFLAEPDRQWTQEALEAETGVSRGLVSRVLETLVAQRYITKFGWGTRGVPAIYRLRDFDRLLDDWAREDAWPRRTAIRQYSLLQNEDRALAAQVRDALGAESLAFTQWFAASLRHPYTTPPVVSAYLRDPQRLASFTEREVASGGNLWLITPRDQGVFHFTRTVGGFPLVADVQIYLDLLRVGQRGPEQAQALRQWEGFGK